MDGGHRRRRRIAVHYSGRASQVRPAVPHAAILVGLVEQRLGDVRADLRLQQGHQLQLRAVHVPTGIVGVLRLLALGQGVNVAVDATVAPVAITEQIGGQQGVVQRGVEHGAFVRGAATDLHLPQLTVPGRARGCLGGSERGTDRAFAAQVGARTGLVHIGDANACGHHRAALGIEADPATCALAHRRMALSAIGGATTAFARAFLHFFIAPGATHLERLVELGDEVQRVIAFAAIFSQIAAEVAGGHRATHGARGRIDHDRGIAAAYFTVRGAEQQVGRLVGRERELPHRRAVGCTQRDIDAVVEGELVRAGTG